MTRIACALLALGSGCAQVFGIEDTTGAAQSASLEVSRVSLGASVVTNPLDLGSAPPTFYAGASSAPSTLGADGRWTTTLRGADRVGYRAPDLPASYQHVFALTASVLRTSFIAFEHPNPQPAPTTSLTIDVTLPTAYAAGEQLVIAAIGAWTAHGLVSSELPAVDASAISTAIPYASFAAMTASPPAQITVADVVCVLRYVGTQLTGVFVAPAFDQSISTTISGPMTAVTAATPFDATIDPSAVASRFAALVPATSGLGITWQIVAAPGGAVGAFNGIELAAGNVAMTDTTIGGSFDDPFATQPWPPVLIYQASVSRTFTLGGSATTLGAALVSYVDPASGLALDLPGGLPTMISIGQVALTSDGMTAPIDPSGPLDIAITTDRSSCTYYAARLDDIAVVGTEVTRTPVIDIGGTSPTLTLPADALQRSHTYAITATCMVGGYAGAQAGDLHMFTLPASLGVATSAAFTIAP